MLFSKYLFILCNLIYIKHCSFTAMTMTAFIWDYITPYMSMKTLFILALLSDSILNIVSSGVRSYYIFLLVKFISGIL